MRTSTGSSSTTSTNRSSQVLGLLKEARAADTPRERVSLARRAIKLDPHNCDGHYILGMNMKDPARRIEHLELSWTAGIVALGKDTFVNNNGRLMRNVAAAARPMEAAREMAWVAWKARDYERAISTYRTLLQVDLTDPLDCRYRFASLCLELGTPYTLAMAQTILSAYASVDVSHVVQEEKLKGTQPRRAWWHYTAALVLLWQGRIIPEFSLGAYSQYQLAQACNYHITAGLVGDPIPSSFGAQDRPGADPNALLPGSTAEAREYLGFALKAWKTTPGGWEFLIDPKMPRMPIRPRPELPYLKDLEMPPSRADRVQ